MCPNRQIDSPIHLAAVIELVHNVNRPGSNNDPIDLYRLHARFTTTDEPEDDVADANQNVGYEFGYGRPDLGEYEFEDEETREYLEEYLEMFWPGPELLWVREYESPVGSDDEGEDENEGEGGGEQAGGGDGEGGDVRTNNTDSTTTTAAAAAAAAVAAGEEQDLSTSSEHTDPDTPVTLASSNTNTQQATQMATNNDASAGESQAQND